jgi:hypothetical protein
MSAHSPSRAPGFGIDRADGVMKIRCCSLDRPDCVVTLEDPSMIFTPAALGSRYL